MSQSLIKTDIGKLIKDLITQKGSSTSEEDIMGYVNWLLKKEKKAESEALQKRAKARAAQGPPEGLRRRARGDHQQPVVKSIHHGGSDGPRPAGTAL